MTVQKISSIFFWQIIYWGISFSSQLRSFYNRSVVMNIWIDYWGDEETRLDPQKKVHNLSKILPILPIIPHNSDWSQFQFSINHESLPENENSLPNHPLRSETFLISISLLFGVLIKKYSITNCFILIGKNWSGDAEWFWL